MLGSVRVNRVRWVQVKVSRRDRLGSTRDFSMKVRSPREKTDGRKHGRARSGVVALLVATGLRLFPAAAWAEAPKVSGELILAWQSTRGEPQTRVEIRIRVAKGWHINSHDPADSYLVPTEVEITPPEGLAVEAIEYPEPVARSLAFAPGKVFELYEGSVVISAKLRGRAKRGGVVKATVRYQACSDTVCLRPASFALELALDAARPPEASTSGTDAVGHPGMVELWMARGGYGYALAALFVLGLALNLTPCVYPLISVTVAYFGSQAPTQGRRWLMAACYVLGICLTFSTVGVSAALSGGLFGAALQRPAVLLAIAGLMGFFAAGSFGFYQWRVPSGLATRAGRAVRGLLGAFVMGLTMGVVAAPCIGPVVAGVLLFVGSRQDPLEGSLFFFVMALGLGFPYLLLAVASGALRQLPRSGAWLEWVEKLFGFVLLGMAVYFAAPVVGDRIAGVAAATVVAGGGVYLGFRFGQFGRRMEIARKLFGVGACCVAVYLVLPVGAQPAIAWLDFRPELVKIARAQGKPAIVEFTAAWCLPCREMERTTFRSREVEREAKGFLMLRADVTAATPQSDQWMSMFGVNGVPTIIFLRPDGAEETRALGFVGPEEFLALLRRARGGRAEG